MEGNGLLVVETNKTPRVVNLTANETWQPLGKTRDQKLPTFSGLHSPNPTRSTQRGVQGIRRSPKMCQGNINNFLPGTWELPNFFFAISKEDSLAIHDSSEEKKSTTGNVAIHPKSAAFHLPFSRGLPTIGKTPLPLSLFG